MYCKHCGKQIADDSKFCQHCGGNLEDIITTSTTEVASESPSKEKVVEIPTIKANFTDTTKWWIIWCGIWLVINLYWLFAGDKADHASEYFQPFSDKIHSDYSYYDITEFIVYVIGLPFIIGGLVMLNKKLNSDSETSNDPPTPEVKRENNSDINDVLGL